MNPERSNDYRDFASAAKEAGFDKDERKLAAMDPELLFEGTSESLRAQLNPEMLESFFKALREDETADSKKLLDIGNFLYQYRLDKEQASESVPEPLNERDCRLVNLACVLTENAFYNGKLNNLDDERAAALAFITNVLAKILEQSPDNDKLAGFSEGKLAQFITEVHNYEQESLFGKTAAIQETEKGGVHTAREEALSEKQAEILGSLQRADSLKPKNGWLDYFKDIPERLEQAKQTLLDGQMLSYKEHELLDSVIRGFKTKTPQVIGYFEERTSKLSNMVAAGLDTASGKKILNLSDSGKGYSRALSDVLLLNFPDNLPLHSHERQHQRGEFMDDSKRLVGIYKRIDEKIASSAVLSGKAPKKTFHGWNEITRGLSTLQWPQAAEILGLVVEKQPKGPWGEYLAAYVDAADIARKTIKNRELDIKFIQAEERLLPKLKGKKSTVPYLIKSHLIAKSMLGEWDEKSRDSSEFYMAMLESPFDYKERGEKTPSHSFLPEGGGRWTQDEESGGLRQNLGPAYSNLHFIPEELPFNVWAIKYFRSHGQEK